MSIRTPANLAASTARLSPSTLRRPHSRKLSPSASRPTAPAWAGETAKLHAAYLDWSTPPEAGPGPVQMGPIMNYLETVLPDDTIFTNGAGNYATWIHRFHRFRRFGTQAAPTSGSMGYGTPAAVAAQGAATPTASSSPSPATAAS